MKRNDFFAKNNENRQKCNKNSCWREYATLRNVVTGGASDCDKAIYGKIMSDGITIIIIVIIVFITIVIVIILDVLLS